MMQMPNISILAVPLILVLAGCVGLAGYRMLRGPGYADRFVALDMLTPVAVSMAALTTLLTGRSAFLDVGLGVALINFASTCAFALFLERKRRRQ